ncbi:C-GCAxxG-C-C family protein [Maribellus sediminis]|uniref:C-GCAxxG-C-C family protein n=1 Tax=Maribellus sediminis TaxID=2696285 RepID=UPI0014317512|nr:C-GCAxxG-C-C family protein [Maribellus sediminis]
MENTLTIRKEARKLLFKLGCTGALNAVVNQHLGRRDVEVEKASGPLCGGIMQEGHQCGMLWGAAMAAGSVAWRRTENTNRATVLAIKSSSELIKSFEQRSVSVDCRVITKCNQTSVWGMVKYFITGKPLGCARLIGKWAPEAVAAAEKGLVENGTEEGNVVSCASVLAEKMGASKEKAMMLAGFAGGIGLCGNACGALGAAVYLRSEEWFKKHPNDTTFKIPEGQDVLKRFLQETDGKVKCSELCGRKFSTVEEHSEYIQNGGCKHLIDVLASV